MTDWRDVERVIEDLKRDGYQPTGLKSSTSEPWPEKSFLLKVERTDQSENANTSDTEAQ